MKVIVVGGGISGLTMAMSLNQIGVEVRVYEAAREVTPLGVGINVQPNAVRELTELGLGERLAKIGIATEALAKTKLRQLAHRIGLNIDADTERRHFPRGFINAHRNANLMQAHRHGEAADPAADDNDLHRLFPKKRSRCSAVSSGN